MASTVDISEPNACSIHLAAVGGGLTRAGFAVSLVAPKPANARAPALDFKGLGITLEQPVRGRRFGLPNTFAYLAMIPGLVMTGRKTRATGHRPVFYSRFSPASVVALAALRLFGGRPFIVSEHNGWIADEAKAGGWPGWMAWLAGMTQRLDSSIADAVRVVSDEIAQELASKRIRGRNLFVAENACDTERLRPIPREQALAGQKLDPSRRYVGFIGNLTVWQGVATALDAFALLMNRYPDLDFVLAGAGPELANLKAQADRLGLGDRVHLLGWVPIERSNEVMNCLDVALCPFPGSRPMGSPVKLRDYAAAGRCILASRFQAIVKVANEDWAAFHDCDDADDLACQLALLLDDPSRRTRLAHAARQFAESRFSWDAVISAIVSHIPAE